jgi:hypothetical protein
VTRWAFYVVTRPGRKHPYRREEGSVIELTGEVPRDLPLTPTVAAQIDRAYELAIPIGMGENRRTFVGLTEDDLRSLAAAVQRNEVGFAATTSPLVEKPRPAAPKRPSYRPPARVVPIRRGPVATYEEAERALKDIGHLDEREVRALLDEYNVYYHPSDNLHVLREVARDALAHYGEMPEPGEIPPSAVPQASPDPRQIRWAAAGKRRHARPNSGVGKVHRELRSLLRK